MDEDWISKIENAKKERQSKEQEKVQVCSRVEELEKELNDFNEMESKSMILI
jgi:hypothetical protein